MRTAEGIRAAQWSSLGLLIAGGVELAIFAVGNSAGLLADSIHNLGDVSTTIALWAAFSLSRRARSDRYPYGFHRAEDLAGMFVLLVMTASAAAAGYGSLRHLITGEHPDHLALSAAAAIVGCLGNEIVAEYKLRTGRRIGSIALIADGNHSRTDGLVSLAALAGIAGVWAGFARADGLAGALITLVIAGVIVSSARGVMGRALDAVDPALTGRVREITAAVTPVTGVHDVRVRWAGRALFVAVSITLPPQMPLEAAHATAEQVRHALLHEIENLVEVDVHMDPAQDHALAHALTAHHEEGSRSEEPPPNAEATHHDHAHDGGGHGATA